MGVVYKLTNRINGKQYIGSTMAINERLIQHKGSANNPRTKIAKAINKHGWDNFTYEILFEDLNFSNLLKYEGEQISSIQTFGKHGYNTNGAGKSNALISFRPSPVTIEIITTYMDKHGCSRSQAINSLLELGFTVYIKRYYDNL